MRPAVCAICGMPCLDDPRHGEGDWIEFSNYVVWDGSSLGHPDGLEYFCSTHATAARALTAMNSEQALLVLRQQFGNFPPYKRAVPPSLWQRLFSKNRDR